MLEADPVAGEAVDIGCVDYLIAVASDFERTQLVTNADDDVGFVVHVRRVGVGWVVGCYV